MSIDADGWLDDWDHVNLDSGLSWTGGPGKLILHTGEGGQALQGLINGFQRNPSIVSHAGVSWAERRRAQFVSLLHSAKSLRNLPGGVETNRDQVYQIEICDTWTDTPSIPEDGLEYIGDCVADFCRSREY